MTHYDWLIKIDGINFIFGTYLYTSLLESRFANVNVIRLKFARQLNLDQQQEMI